MKKRNKLILSGLSSCKKIIYQKSKKICQNLLNCGKFYHKFDSYLQIFKNIKPNFTNNFLAISRLKSWKINQLFYFIVKMRILRNKIIFLATIDTYCEFFSQISSANSKTNRTKRFSKKTRFLSIYPVRNSLSLLLLHNLSIRVKSGTNFE